MRLPRRAGSLLPQINPSQVVPTLPNADEPKTSKRLRRECAKGFDYKVGSAVAMVACVHIAFVPALNPGTAMHGVHNTGDLPVHQSRR